MYNSVILRGSNLHGHVIMMNSKYMYLAFWFESLAFKKREPALTFIWLNEPHRKKTCIRCLRNQAEQPQKMVVTVEA